MTNFQCITAEEAKQKIQISHVTLLDVRQAEDFKKSHIQDAKLLNHINFVDFVEATDKKAHIIVYCYHGVSSRHIASYLLNHDFETVYSMDGGFAAWQEAGYPICLNEGEKT